MFIENKYTKCYYSIIDNAKLQTRKKKNGTYYESHHIIPKSMGGIEEVLLTAKEHYICHLLLCKMLTGKNKHKMINALIRLSFSKSNGQERYTSRSYSLVRKFIAEKNSEMFKGKPKSESVKQNMKGRSGTWIRTEEHKKELSNQRKGKYIGTDNHFFGKKHSIESILKRSETRKQLGIVPKFIGKGCKHYNNGEKSVFCLPGAEPPGYKLGRIMKNMKDIKNASTQE
ncbi:Nuclease associated modular domain 3 [uncultured Caudovirales phage]|uniref:Nuclease associated modular domain 3 n=1 Tax=uncultured Caudovirales phage TaxID=2100421 RepID=A0A6J5NZA2_9CAUD|nr:Nuclease associated modular domain 3 [uncultured Caudovirales phage]